MSEKSLEIKVTTAADSSGISEVSEELGQLEEQMSRAAEAAKDAVTGCDPAVTEYVMSQPAKCPGCHRDVTEKTLVIAG